MPSRLDKEKARKNLAVILEKMQSDTDISLLNEYHKLYKKEVSLFRRSWAAAWLLMYYDQKEAPGAFKGGKKPGFDGKNESKSAPPSAASPSVSSSPAESENVLSEQESKRLFISIGKNRRLYPREVITLIMSKTSSAREDIGVIRILDNYSFIQVRDTKTDEIIEALNGVKFRGRTLTVNYAKPRAGESEGEGESRPRSE